MKTFSFDGLEEEISFGRALPDACFLFFVFLETVDARFEDA